MGISIRIYYVFSHLIKNIFWLIISLKDCKYNNYLRNEGHKTLLSARLNNPVSLLVTMASKTVPMWASNDTSISFAFSDNIDNTNLYNALLGVINIIKEKDKFNYSFLFLIILIGYFLAHLILEVKPRYRYFAIPIFFIMAAYGFTKSKLTYKFLKE